MNEWGVADMNKRIANLDDFEIIHNYDKHISEEELKTILCLGRVIVAEQNNQFIGWLRYNLFWDNTPFMNMLFVLEEFRESGIGKELVLYWEKAMKDLKYDLVMTSTLSNESTQHFYRKLKYVDSGSLLLPDEPLEIIFIKKI